jgi:CRP/FNR family transcriptional regulator, cyclic AMP receptor protein
VDNTDRWVAILSDGRVRVLGADGARILATRSAGDIVGEQALIERRARSATVLADTPVRARVLGAADLDRLLARHPRILRVLCVVLSERLRESDRNLGDLGDRAFTKVIYGLLRLAESGRPVPSRGIRVRIGSQAKLGSLLGVSRESVVRALGRLRKEQLIATNRGVVTIYDIAALRDSALVTNQDSTAARDAYRSRG